MATIASAEVFSPDRLVGKVREVLDSVGPK
jgi:hypothetical protein